MSYTDDFLSTTPSHTSFLSAFLPHTWLNYDGEAPLIKPRASRERKYTEMSRDYRTTNDIQIQRETRPRDTRERPVRDREPQDKKPGNSLLRHSLTLIGIGMLITLLLVVLAQFTGNWVSNTVDDIRYGNPRTYQTDAMVGHEAGKTPSHFIIINLHGKIEIIEFPGGDGSKAKIYLGPQLYDINADHIPVKLQFIDVHHNKHPDMYIQFGSTQIIYHNTADGFQPS